MATNANAVLETNLAYHLYSLIRDEEIGEDEESVVLQEIVPKSVLGYIVEQQSDADRDLYFLYHVDTSEEELTPGLGAISETNSPWGKPASAIAFSRALVPMLSDIFLGTKWDDYRETENPRETLWGNSMNVLYFDGHVNTVQVDNYEWAEVLPSQ